MSCAVASSWSWISYRLRRKWGYWRRRIHYLRTRYYSLVNTLLINKLVVDGVASIIFTGNTGNNQLIYFQPDQINRYFCIPLVLKCSIGTISTEADALRFLNSCGIDLPIPRIFDSFVLDGNTHTVMTRIDGEIMLIHKQDTMSDEHLRLIVEDLFTVLRSLWTLRQPEQDAGKVMLSASGHGMPSPVQFFYYLEGPFDNILECYDNMSRHLVDSVESSRSYIPTLPRPSCPTPLYMCTPTFEATTSWLRMVDWMELLIGRIRAGCQSIGSCMFCGVYAQVHATSFGSYSASRRAPLGRKLLMRSLCHCWLGHTIYELVWYLLFIFFRLEACILV